MNKNFKNMRTISIYVFLALISSNTFANNDCLSIKGNVETASFSGLNDTFNIDNFFVSKKVMIDNKELNCQFRTGIPVNWSVSDKTCYSFKIFATGNEAKEKYLTLDSLKKCAKF